MTSLIPRKPYSSEELEALYPQNLELQLVQILLRHGERSPVSPRFQNAGLTAYWPYCNAARTIRSVVLSQTDNSDDVEWDSLSWRRRLETFSGPNDEPVVAKGPHGNYDGICVPGELTDEGRISTTQLGQRLRHLYIDQLEYMPNIIGNADSIYIRATPIPRALESVQQVFWGMYPKTARTANFPPPTIVTRSPGEETLFPNDSTCRRFAEISREFAQRAADRWNDSKDLAYVQKKIGKWMPDGEKVAVDSHPRLSGIMDTINATRGHGKPTKLPREFYDPDLIKFIERIGVEEWFQGYNESQEYRKLGIGGLVGDVVARMVGNAEQNDQFGIEEVGGDDQHHGVGRGGEKIVKFGLSGCHDTTLAAMLSSLGCFNGEAWPPYTSHVAVELFRQKGLTSQPDQTPLNSGSKFLTWFRGQWPAQKGSDAIGRSPLAELRDSQKEKLEGYFVRIRYNDEVMKIPGCKPLGKHLDGDDSLCTLMAFKEIVDKFTPKNWKAECMESLGQPAFPPQVEPSGI